MKYTIYQIKDIEKTSYAFRGWYEARKKFNYEDYKDVYIGDVDVKVADKDIKILESLYEKFNIDHPSDFTGHSLSVSDIVMLTDGNRYNYYYCDSFGWEDITEDIRKGR